jgi:FkbM family methyltransferase
MGSLPLWRLRTFARGAAESVGLHALSKPACFDIERKLLSYFDRPGFFIEAGAVDGYFESNTYFLDQIHGWSGILVEPSPTMFSRIRVNRPRAKAFNCALVSFDYRRPTVTLDDAHAISKVIADGTGVDPAQRRAVDVPARTLQSIIDECGAPDIDLISLDVEGYEGEVLAGLDFARSAPRFILIECLNGEARRRIESILSARYDCVEEFSYRDVFFRRREPQPASA